MIVIDSSFWIELFGGSEIGRVIKENKHFEGLKNVEYFKK